MSRAIRPAIMVMKLSFWFMLLLGGGLTLGTVRGKPHWFVSLGTLGVGLAAGGLIFLPKLLEAKITEPASVPRYVRKNVLILLVLGIVLMTARLVAFALNH